MSASTNAPAPSWATVAAIGGLMVPGIAAYALGMMKKKEGAKMTKSERMFFTVVRVLQEEIERLTGEVDSANNRRNSEQQQYDKLVADLRRERDRATAEVTTLSLNLKAERDHSDDVERKARAKSRSTSKARA